MLLNKLISTGASLVILGTGILGGIHGNAITAQNAADLTARENVSTLVAKTEAAGQSHAAAQGRATVEAFAPTIDTATALVASSDGKASPEARVALDALLDEVSTKIDAHYATGVEARDAATQIVAFATPEIAAASQTINDQVAAWEAAEAARIEAERIAAEEAARATSRSNGGGGSYSGSNGGSNSGGGNSGGGGSCTDRYAATAAANGARFVLVDGNTSYYDGGVIQMGNGPANACADAVFSHELAHHFTMGSGRAGCADISRNLNSAAGLGQRHVETWAQAYTQTYWGWAADWAYAPAPQSYIDGMSAAGCL